MKLHIGLCPLPVPSDSDGLKFHYMRGAVGFQMIHPDNPHTAILYPSTLCMSACLRNPLCQGIHFTDDQTNTCLLYDYNYMDTGSVMTVSAGGALIFFQRDTTGKLSLQINLIYKGPTHVI